MRQKTSLRDERVSLSAVQELVLRTTKINLYCRPTAIPPPFEGHRRRAVQPLFDRLFKDLNVAVEIPKIPIQLRTAFLDALQTIAKRHDCRFRTKNTFKPDLPWIVWLEKRIPGETWRR